MMRICSEEERAEVVEKVRHRVAEFLALNNRCFTAKSIAQAIASPVFASWLIEDMVHELYAKHDPCFAGAARYFEQRIYYFRAPDYVVAEAREDK